MKKAAYLNVGIIIAGLFCSILSSANDGDLKAVKTELCSYRATSGEVIPSTNLRVDSITGYFKSEAPDRTAMENAEVSFGKVNEYNKLNVYTTLSEKDGSQMYTLERFGLYFISLSDTEFDAVLELGRYDIHGENIAVQKTLKIHGLCAVTTQQAN